MTFEPWQQWGLRPEEAEGHHADRLTGQLPEMESTKQLVKLISKIYKPKMRILDVGCNVGHYLLGLEKKFPSMTYKGVDAYEQYIEKAKIAFSKDENVSFEVKDIFKPLFPNNPFDIVYCCNVLLHLPDFRIPVKNLLDSTKSVCFIRTLLGNKTSIVKTTVIEKFDDDGNPLDFNFLNTWSAEYFTDYVKSLGWKTEIIPDEFNFSNIEQEYEGVKKDDKKYSGTKIIGKNQVVDNIICNWTWIKISKN